MGNILDTSFYDRVLLIDTQVILETKHFSQLPWSEFGDGPLLLLVCRQVQWELDDKKNDGRVGKRAREFNKLMDSFIETRCPATLQKSGPRVDVASISNAGIDWDSLDDLDRNEGDDRIVAQALSAHIDDRARIELLSYDMRPRDAAYVHGLQAVKLPEHWLRDVEPSPDEKERAKLQEQVKLLKADQPEISVSIEAITPVPWKKVTVGPPAEDQISKIALRILSTAPTQSPRDRYSFTSFGWDNTFEDRKTSWRNRLLSRELPNMHLGLQKIHAQKRIRVTIKNTGSIVAEGLSLEIRTGNTVLHSRPYHVHIFGREAPHPRLYYDLVGRDLNIGLQSPQRNQPFTFYIDQSGPGENIILSCESFRQEKSFSVELSVELPASIGAKAQIEAVVTARNLKGDQRAQLIVPIVSENLNFEDAFNPDARKFVTELQYNALRQIGDDDELTWFQNDGSVSDDD